jgi:hypothetical protein
MNNLASDSTSECGYFSGSAFQILRSSKKPSLPIQPNSTLDLVGGDAWGLEEGNAFAVDGGAHGFEHGGV